MKSLLLTLLTFLTVQAQPNIDAALSEARTLLNQGKTQEAIAKLEPLQTSTDARIKQQLGVAYYRTNNSIKAIEYLTASLTGGLAKINGEKKQCNCSAQRITCLAI